MDNQYVALVLVFVTIQYQGSIVVDEVTSPWNGWSVRDSGTRSLVHYARTRRLRDS